jgi:predicted nucleic acid-binding protein
MAGPTCCDTSFLFSLYGRDANTPRAAAEVVQVGSPLTVTVLGEYELLNAVRFAAFRGLLPASGAGAIIAAFEADLVAGRLVIERSNLAQIVSEAKRLSALHTAAGGHRSFDILHVATAVLLTAEAFNTFDANQRALAVAAGLKVRP